MHGVKIGVEVHWVLIAMLGLEGLAYGQATPAPSLPAQQTYSTNLFKLNSTPTKITIEYILGSYRLVAPVPDSSPPRPGSPPPLSTLTFFAGDHSYFFWDVGSGKAESDAKIVIDSAANWGYTPPTAHLNFIFKFGKSGVPLDCNQVLNCTIEAKWNDSKRQYTCKNTDLDQFADKLVVAINQLRKGFDADTPIPAISGAVVMITPQFPGVDARSLSTFAVDTALDIDFQQVLVHVVKPPAPAALGQAAQESGNGGNPQTSNQYAPDPRGAPMPDKRQPAPIPSNRPAAPAPHGDIAVPEAADTVVNRQPPVTPPIPVVNPNQQTPELPEAPAAPAAPAAPPPPR